MTRDSALLAIDTEAEVAQGKYGDFASMHEGWGVLEEEYRELTEAIRLQQTDPQRASRIRREAIQVAAVALRIAEQAERVRR